MRGEGVCSESRGDRESRDETDKLPRTNPTVLLLPPAAFPPPPPPCACTLPVRNASFSRRV